MVCFTVMDHDVITANDFGGEAFLALGSIPGVADYNSSVENFHGLKQIELPLMQQLEKSKYMHNFNFCLYSNLSIYQKLDVEKTISLPILPVQIMKAK